MESKERKLSLLDILISKDCLHRSYEVHRKANAKISDPLGIYTKSEGSLRAQSSRTGKEICRIGQVPAEIKSTIQKLYLSSNLFTSLHEFSSFENVKEISLSSNQIKYYEDVIYLQKCTELTRLDLRDNPITLLPYYSDYMLFICPKLKMLDGSSIESRSEMYRQQLAIKAQLSYRKLTNCLSKAIYNEMRNYFVFNLAMRRRLHRDLRNSVYSSRMYRHGESAGHTLPEVLRLLRLGGVFDYLIKSNERFFSKSVQNELCRIAQITRLSRPQVFADPQHLDQHQLYDEALFNELIKIQEMFWIQCLEQYNSFDSMRIDQLESSAKERIIAEIFEEIEKGFYYTPAIEDIVSNEKESKLVTANSRKSASSAKRGKTVTFRDENAYDAEIEEESRSGPTKGSSRSTVFVPQQLKEKRVALSELFDEILRHPENIRPALKPISKEKDKKEAEKKKPMRITTETYSSSEKKPSGVSFMNSRPATDSAVRLSSETLPSQQKEPDTTDDEAANPTATSLRFISPKTAAVIQSLPRTTALPIQPRSLPPPRLPTVKETNISMAPLPPPLDPGMFINNPYYQTLEQGVSELLESYRELEAIRTRPNIQDLLFRSEATFTEIEKLDRKDYKSTVDTTASYLRNLRLDDSRLKQYHRELIQQATHLYETITITTQQFEEYCQKCREELQSQYDEYQQSLALRQEIQNLEEVLMDRQQAIEKNRTIMIQYQEEINQSLELRKAEIQQVSQVNTSNITVNEVLISLRRDISQYSHRQEVIRKLHHSANLRLTRYYYQQWQRYLMNQRKIRQKVILVTVRAQRSTIRRYWQCWQRVYRKEKLVDLYLHRKHYFSEQSSFQQWKQRYQASKQLQQRLTHHRHHQLQRAFRSFHYQLVQQQLRRAQDQQHQLYITLFQLVTKFRAWKNYFLSKYTKWKLLSHRIAFQRRYYLFQAWKRCYQSRQRLTSQKVVFALQHRHRYYFLLHYYRQWWVYAKQQQRIRYHYQLQRGFGWFRKRMSSRLLSHHKYDRQNASHRYPRLITSSERQQPIRFGLVPLFLYYNRWRSYHLLRQERQLQKNRRVVSSFRGSGGVRSRGSLDRYQSHYLRQCLLRLHRQVKHRKHYRIQLEQKRVSIVLYREYLLRYATFSQWKQLYYLRVLDRLKQENNSLKVTNHSFRSPTKSLGTTSTPTLWKENRTPSRSLSQLHEEQVSHLPEQSTTSSLVFPELESLAVEGEIKASSDDTVTVADITEKTKKRSSLQTTHSTPQELLTIKYFFYLWKDSWKETQRLHRLNRLLQQRHRRRILKTVWRFMTNHRLSHLWHRYQQTKRSNQFCSQQIESVHQRANQYPVMIQELRETVSQKTSLLESLKVKLATIEDHVQVTVLHQTDNEQSLQVLQKEQQSLFETRHQLVQEIKTMKLLFSQEQHEQQLTTTKATATTATSPSHSMKKVSPLVATASSSSPSTLKELEQHFQTLLAQVGEISSSPLPSSASSSASSEPNDSLAVITADPNYLQSLSQRIETIYSREIAEKRQTHQQYQEKIAALREKIKEVELEITTIQAKLAASQQVKGQLLQSRIQLQQLLTASQQMLEQHSQQLLEEMMRFEEEMEALQKEKDTLLETIQRLKDREAELTAFIEEQKQYQQQQAMKQIYSSPLLSKEIIEREVDLLLLNKQQQAKIIGEVTTVESNH